jgi:hypothetical protein
MAAPATLGQATPIVGTGNSISHTTTSGPITGKCWFTVGWNDSAGVTTVSLRRLELLLVGTGATTAHTRSSGWRVARQRHLSTNAQSKHTILDDYRAAHPHHQRHDRHKLGPLARSPSTAARIDSLLRRYNEHDNTVWRNTEIHDQNLSATQVTRPVFSLVREPRLLIGNVGVGNERRDHGHDRRTPGPTQDAAQPLKGQS